MLFFFFFFNDTATTEIYTLSYTLSLHDALPICCCAASTETRTERARSCLCRTCRSEEHTSELQSHSEISYAVFCLKKKIRSEEHTSELQSHSEISYAVFCLKKKKKKNNKTVSTNRAKRPITYTKKQKLYPLSCLRCLMSLPVLPSFVFFFFFNDTATTEIYTLSYTLSLHDALPISTPWRPSSTCSRPTPAPS